jgi:purine-nucleoside phosphorylase
MNAQAALQTIQTIAPLARPRVALILGSGWGDVTKNVQEAVRIPYSALQGFPEPSVAGHAGELWLGRIGTQQVAVMSGRRHSYEAGDMDGMNVPLRVLRALGCEILIQTNAAGSLRGDMPPHSLMVLSDHINFAQRSPLVGEVGTARFVNMANAYDADLRTQAQHLAAQQGLPLHEGVYVWAFGPQFETPAEIRMFALLGGDAVGMSCVPETIFARYLGMRVLALSLITNFAAGLSAEVLSHAHTLAQAKASAAPTSQFLADFITQLT